MDCRENPYKKLVFPALSMYIYFRISPVKGVSLPVIKTKVCQWSCCFL